MKKKIFKKSIAVVLSAMILSAPMGTFAASFPINDFSSYANAETIRKNGGRPYNSMQDSVGKVAQLLQQTKKAMAQNPVAFEEGTDKRKIANFLSSLLDPKRDQDGFSPLNDSYGKIDEVSSAKEFNQLIIDFIINDGYFYVNSEDARETISKMDITYANKNALLELAPMIFNNNENSVKNMNKIVDMPNWCTRFGCVPCIIPDILEESDSTNEVQFSSGTACTLDEAKDYLKVAIFLDNMLMMDKQKQNICRQKFNISPEISWMSYLKYFPAVLGASTMQETIKKIPGAQDMIDKSDDIIKKMREILRDDIKNDTNISEGTKNAIINTIMSADVYVWGKIDYTEASPRLSLKDCNLETYEGGSSFFNNTKELRKYEREIDLALADEDQLEDINLENYLDNVVNRINPKEDADKDEIEKIVDQISEKDKKEVLSYDGEVNDEESSASTAPYTDQDALLDMMTAEDRERLKIDGFIGMCDHSEVANACAMSEKSGDMIHVAPACLVSFLIKNAAGDKENQMCSFANTIGHEMGHLIGAYTPAELDSIVFRNLGIQEGTPDAQYILNANYIRAIFKSDKLAYKQGVLTESDVKYFNARADQIVDYYERLDIDPKYNRYQSADKLHHIYGKAVYSEVWADIHGLKTAVGVTKANNIDIKYAFESFSKELYGNTFSMELILSPGYCVYPVGSNRTNGALMFIPEYVKWASDQQDYGVGYVNNKLKTRPESVVYKYLYDLDMDEFNKLVQNVNVVNCIPAA